MGTTDDHSLGNYLKDRRARLDPAAFGLPTTRRRTPGLRREEVAQRANVSATWYTWLEQGRGGTPSAEVLDRLAQALVLNAVERERLFLLAQHRLPEVDYRAAASVSPRLQRVLDSLAFSPALVKNALWDVLAWNRAAAMVLTDYAALAPDQRNILRLTFGQARLRRAMPQWTEVARFIVAAFRADTARAGMPESARALIDELSASSAEFRALWLDHDVSSYGEGTKLLHHAEAGPLAFEYSAFAVDGQPDLGMIVYTPATTADAAKVKALVEQRKA